MPLLKSSIVGIELKDRLAQCVELKPGRSKPEFLAYNRISLPEDLIVNGEIRDEMALSDALKDFFSKANPKIDSIKQAALVLPARLCFVHIFDFPKEFSYKEIQKSLPLQAEGVIPFSIEDVYWDFYAVPDLDGKHQKVVFAAVSKEQADRYARVLQNLGVTPFYFGVELDAIQNALLEHLQTKELKLVIELNDLSSNYLLLSGNEILHFFSSNEGMGALFEELTGEKRDPLQSYFEDWGSVLSKRKHQQHVSQFLEKRFRQGKKIVSAHLPKGQDLSGVILTGEFSTLMGSLEQAKDFFEGLSVEAGDPKYGIEVEASRFVKRGEDFKNNRLYSVFFTQTIGLARRALSYKDTNSVNLLPLSLRSKIKNQNLSLFVSLGIVLMMVSMMCVSAYMIYLQQILTYDRGHLEIEKSGVERLIFGTRYQEIQEELSLFNQEVDVLSSIDAALFSVPVVMKEIVALMPEGIDITELHFDDESLEVEVEGVAKNRDALLEMQNQFKDFDLVETASLPISNFDQKKDISFHMSLVLNFTELPHYGASGIE